MAAGDIYQVRLESAFFGHRFNNVFFYQAGIVSVDDDSQKLADEFVATIVPLVLPLLSVNLTFDVVRVVNGSNNLDNVIQLISELGVRLTNAAPHNLAIAFRQRLGGAGFRYSYKRFGGLTTDTFNAGGWLNTASFFAQANSLSVGLGSLLVDGTANWNPIQITGGFVLGIPPVFKQFLTGAWQINDRTSHQDTRQEFEWKPSL